MPALIRVLLVEDDSWYAEYLTHLVRTLKYEPLGPVQSAEAALRLC